jgi:predicted Zn-dependent peptidase
LVLPQFDRATLPNGLTILVSQRRVAHELPLVRVELVFSAGSASDPDDQAGLASLTYSLLTEGTAIYDALGLDAAFANLGATPELSVEADGATLGVTVLVEHAPAALSLLADMARRPRLERSSFERRKHQQLATIARRSSEPQFLAQQAFIEDAFGPAHPYGHTTLGTRTSVSALEWHDAQRFFMGEVAPATCGLVITGDVTLHRAIRWANEHFASWTGSARRPEAPPTLDQPPARPMRVIEQAGLNQTTLLLGRPSLKAGDPHEAALEIATAAIGGMFSSRLNLNLRERHAYTYGAKAMLDVRRGPSPWLAFAAVRGDATAAALKEIIAELGKLPVDELTQAETDTARQGLIASLPGRFESADDLASAAANIYFLEAPLDRYARLVDSLRAAPAALVNQAATQYLSPTYLSIVAVGDPHVLDGQLSKVSLEPPRAVSTEMAE